MKIKKIEVGSLQTNCYILQSGKREAIIDPGEDEEKIARNLRANKEKDTKVKFVLATHHHWDHVNAVSNLVAKFDADFYLAKKELDLFKRSAEEAISPDQLLVEGERIKLGKNSFQVWETPGHSPGSITLLEEEENALFVGDLLFSSGFGRTDLPGGSRPDLERSLARVVDLPGDWTVYPGHGPIFKLREKITSSPFLSQLKDR